MGIERESRQEVKPPDQRKQQDEKKRRIQERCVRWRWWWTILFSFNVVAASAEVLRKRSEWPGLLSLHAFTAFRDFTSVEWDIYQLLFSSFMLVYTWTMVDQYRRDQARLEMDRRWKGAASEEGVWPPLPASQQ